MRIGQTSLIVFLSKLISSVLGFVATLYFARVLGAEVLGYYALVLTVTRWIKLGGDVGISSAVTKRMSEGEDSSAYFTAGILIVAIFGVASSLLVIGFQDVVNAYVGVESTHFIVLLILVGLFGSIITAALKGDHLVHVAGLLSPVNIGFRSVLQIALVFAGFGLSGMLLGYAGGGIIVGLLGLAFLTIGVERPTIEHFRSLIEFAKFSWLGNLKGRSFNDVDVLVLGAFVSPTLVGIYAIAWNLTGFIGTFGSSIRQATFPELSHADANERERRVANVVGDSIAYSGLIAIPGLFGALVIGDRILLVYGQEFTRGVAVLGLLILAMLIYDYKNQLLTALNAIDRPDLSFRVNVLFVFSNLVLNIALVVLMGWVGAAIATVLATTIGLASAFHYLYGLVDFDIPIWELGRQFLAAGLMAVVVAGVQWIVESTDLTGYNAPLVIGLVIIGAGIYFALLFTISTRFRNTVLENVPNSVPFVF